MGIGTRLYDTACTYTQSGDVAPLLYHYRLCSQLGPCWEWDRGKPSRSGVGGLLGHWQHGGCEFAERPLGDLWPLLFWTPGESAWSLLQPCVLCGRLPVRGREGEGILASTISLSDVKIHNTSAVDHLHIYVCVYVIHVQVRFYLYSNNCIHVYIMYWYTC